LRTPEQLGKGGGAHFDGRADQGYDYTLTPNLRCRRLVKCMVRLVQKVAEGWGLWEPQSEAAARGPRAAA